MKKLLTVSFLCAFPLSAHALTNEALLEGAKLCTRHMPRYEREYGIPTHLLGAIATTETGRFHNGLDLSIPWPWTINAEGKGHFYDSKEQAVAAARRMQAQGIQSMDVGCMQVNLYHHPNAFSSLDEAFEPEKNVAYAAGFLRNLYQESGSWRTASAGYHSKTPERGNKYVGLVYDRWHKIIEKLRMAKQYVPDSTVAAINDKSQPAPAPVAVAAKVIPVKPRIVEAKASSYRPVRMNSIQVRTEEPVVYDQGIMVVKPEIKVVDDTPVQTAALATPLHAADDARVIRLDNSRVVQTPLAQHRTMPNFIFAD